jgi:hypothetical protein
MAEKPRVAKMVADLLSGGRLWTRRGQCRNLVASCLRELLPFFEQSSEFEEVVEETPDVVKETI